LNGSPIYPSLLPILPHKTDIPQRAPLWIPAP
jgi:hypothetical protein